MPWSDESGDLKSRALERFSHSAILSRIQGVVDLGAGAGLWRSHSRKLPIGQKPWTAVEIHRPNVQRFKLKERYDHVVQRDFRKIKYGKLGGHLFIFGDVLEHLEREDALDVVRRASSMGSVVVVMPFSPTTSAEQGASDGNEWERHRYIWRWGDFISAIDPKMMEIVQAPPGAGRNKGCLILWHPGHRPDVQLLET